ncbi:MAG: helix-turn-helix domain-containing protein [Proteobacteria bacterium]|nr:helix-turn-helix domain-containing protein [Pseudomonadota bacterium]MBU1640001.1 helix-turn-helix domain-containing protein [Pseudomonadota bacterium]
MKDNDFQSNTAMVRIDGSLVRQLREEKGLTQLYLATAVGVTTDTISRWENRHYQSVKMDNARRLANALEVELKVILEVEEEPGQSVAPEIEMPLPIAGSGKRKTTVLLFAFALFFVVLYLFFYSSHKEPVPEVSLSATRKIPSHAMPGYPFPVVIVVEAPSSTPLSVVIKESLPANIQVTSSSAFLQPLAKAELKWIVKHLAGRQRFGYMATAQGAEPVHFHGSVHTRAGQGKEVVVGGRQSLAMAPFHWADSNQDGIISDDEILVVYDDFDDVAGLTVDVELVEDMWMGSRYSWNQEAGVFEVIP